MAVQVVLSGTTENAPGKKVTRRNLPVETKWKETPVRGKGSIGKHYLFMKMTSSKGDNCLQFEDVEPYHKE